MKKTAHFTSSAVLMCFATLLGACTPIDEDMPKELQGLTQGIKGKIEELPVYKPYAPTAYEVGNLADPFGAVKVQIAMQSGNSDLAQPDAKRVREPLEAFPIESLQFNGTMVQRGIVHALITAQENLYTVKLGSHLGENFGRVIKISENEIILMEKIQDPNGNWVEREKPLALSSQ